MLRTLEVIIEPTKIKAGPVDHGGKLAKMGEKKMEMKKPKATVIAVKPVRPPSAMPAPDSTKAVQEDVPKQEPIETAQASAKKAHVECSKSPPCR